MSVTKRIAFGAAASWFGRGVTIALGLVLMPVLFRHLPKEELGIWILLGQSWATLGILDLGFGATLTRRIAFAKGQSGGDPNSVLSDATLADIANLVAVGRRIYVWLSALAFAVAFGLGFVYLRGLELQHTALPTVWSAWAVLCLSQAINVWATPWTCLLQGVGYIGWDAVLASLVSTLTLLLQIGAVLLGGGLVALACVAALGAVAQRWLVFGFARRKRPELFHFQGKWNPAIFQSIVLPAFRAWLTAMGLALALNSDQLFIAKMEGAKELPAYRAAYLVLLNLNIIAVTSASASAVFISHLWQVGNIREVQRIVIRNSRLGLGVMACGGGCILALGTRLFDLWLGEGNFIGFPILVIFFVLLFLEAQSFIIATSSRATEDEAFALWAVSAGVLKLTLSYALGMRFGLLGIAMGTLLAQLVTNHWYMVWRGLNRLKLGFADHFGKVLVPVSAAFTVTFFGVALILRPLEKAPLLILVGASAGITGLVLISFLWCLVLDQSQRQRLARRLGFGIT
jgi:O-antigen/teichoic acid export membrane protein